MNEAYKYGKIGYSLSYAKGNTFLSSLTDTQKQYAYDLGRQAAARETEAKQANIDAVPKSSTKKNGKVVMETDGASLTEVQKTSLKAIEAVTMVTGNTIHVYASEEVNGKRVFAGDVNGHRKGTSAPNGFYDTSTGDIYIDLNAGNSGEGTMLFTTSHELTHFIRQWSPAKFKVLSDFLMEQYGKKGESMDNLVNHQIELAKKNGKEMSYDSAWEEVVANSMERMLTDTDVLSKLTILKHTDRGLFNKIKEFISGLFDKIKEVYSRYDSHTAEGQMVGEMKDALEKLSDLFSEALVDAGERYQQVGFNVVDNFLKQYGNEHSKKLYSFRGYNKDGIEVYETSEETKKLTWDERLA